MQLFQTKKKNNFLFTFMLKSLIFTQKCKVWCVVFLPYFYP